MSEESLKRLKRSLWSQARVNIEKCGVCLPAAVDGISRGEVSEAYAKHIELRAEDSISGPDSARTLRAWQNPLRDTGRSLSGKNMSDKVARDPGDIENILNNAREGGRGVIVYTAERHVVGLRPVSDGWRAVGTEVPFDDEVLTADDIYSKLAKPKRDKRGRLSHNIVLLPSEPRRSGR